MVEYVMSREMYENLKKELKTSNNKGLPFERIR